VVWRAVPIFIGVGLVFPALLTTLTFSSNRLLGPLVTVALSAVLLSNVRVTVKLACGTVAAVAGVILVLVG
jgi:hypothetical protein